MAPVVSWILEHLGNSFLMPAILAFAGTLAIKALMSLHQSSRQTRKEFLDTWDKGDATDNLRLEVAVRHWVGTYLPAGLIRIICGMPYPSSTLRTLAEIWPAVRFDQQTGRLEWKSRSYESSAGVWLLILASAAGYLVFACLAALFFYLCMRSMPSEALAWASVLNAFAFLVLAIVCLNTLGTVLTARHIGAALLSDINAKLGSTTVKPVPPASPEVHKTPDQSDRTGPEDSAPKLD